ncbi:MAG: HAMP domain-containing histidine kinase [Cytophagaceae bacterium]|nr:HAMP domain-containing histidine kinase [Cytophagaceae bacterium]
MKSQTKIAIIFFIVCLSIILLLSGAVYYLSTKYSFTDFYARLQIRAVIAAKSHLENEEIKAEAFKEVRKMHLEKLPQEKDYFFKVTPGKTFEKEAKELGVPLDFFDEMQKTENATYKANNTFYSGIKYNSKMGTYLVIVSANNYYNDHHLVYLRNIFFIGISVASILALLISIMFAKKVFTPVKQITDQVKEISSENMHLRLQHPQGNDEISELIITFNNMLDRLETAFETQNNFISNASHELSTPLTAIIGEADVALNKVRKPQEYTESLKVILKEADRLDRITKSLLFLAQTGFDGKKQKIQIVRTDQLLWDVKETIDRINSNNQITIDLSLIPENPVELKINGNPQLLHLALTNIVTNACKYSSNKPVNLSIAAQDNHVTITVKDMGIGIPANELTYIYNPFFRASNTKNFEGYGIGLSLARNIIRMHKGAIEISSVIDQGTTVQIRFPSINHHQVNSTGSTKQIIESLVN